MKTTSFATIASSALVTVAGGADKRNLAQNGGADYVDHSYGFGNTLRGGFFSYATPNGFGGRAAFATSCNPQTCEPGPGGATSRLKVLDPNSAIPL